MKNQIFVRSRSISRILFFCMLWLSSSLCLAGENVWTPIGPEGVSVSALAIDQKIPSTLYVGTESGTIFKTTDKGKSWELMNNGEPLTGFDFPEARTVTALALDPVNPQIIYAGTGSIYRGMHGKGVFKSVDGAKTFKPINEGLNKTSLYIQSVFTLAVNPTNPKTLYVGTVADSFFPWGASIFKSEDGGSSWRKTGDGHVIIYSFAIDVSNPQIIYAGTYEGALKSTDGGESWGLINGLPFDPISSLAVVPQTPSITYAGTAGGIFKSMDEGKTWKRIGIHPVDPWDPISAIVLAPQNPENIYVAWGQIPICCFGGSLVFRSRDGGKSWSPLKGEQLPLDEISLVVDVSDPRTLYAGTSMGVWSLTQTDLPVGVDAKGKLANTWGAVKRSSLLQNDSNLSQIVPIRKP